MGSPPSASGVRRSKSQEAGEKEKQEDYDGDRFDEDKSNTKDKEKEKEKKGDKENKDKNGSPVSLLSGKEKRARMADYASKARTTSRPRTASTTSVTSSLMINGAQRPYRPVDIYNPNPRVAARYV